MRINDHSLNRLKIVKAIRRFGPVARTDLPELTGLSAGLITQETSKLVSRNLVIERKDVEKGQGRPRTFLEINGDGAIVIGASINGRGVLTATFVTMAGQKRESVEVDFSGPDSLAKLPGVLAGAIDEAISRSAYKTSSIARVGVGLPGLINSTKGEVHSLTMFPAEVVQLAAPMSNMLSIPVTIESDMVSLARAEHWFGHAREQENFSMIHVGDFVSSAEFAYGQPRYGSNGLNSEIGHMKTGIGEAAHLCLCGASGCLATYCSMYGILESKGMLRDLPFPPVEILSVQFDKFMDQASSGNATAVAAVQQAGKHLGIAISNLLNASDPGVIYIAIDNKKYLELLQQPFRKALISNTLPGVLSATEVEFFQTSKDWRWTGTAAMALERAYLGDS